MSISLKNDAGTFSTNLNQSNPTANVNIALPTTGGTMAKVEDKLVLGTAQTATGTSVDFTGIPSWAKRITVMFSRVSTNGASTPIIQLGDSGGIENTGYLSAGTVNAGATVAITSNSTIGFIIGSGGSSTDIRNGNITITKLVSDTWSLSGVIGYSSSTVVAMFGGSKTLSATLDRIRITTVNGTDTFDAGTINIMWE